MLVNQDHALLFTCLVLFFSALKNVKHEGEVTEIQPIKPIDLLPHEKNKFFRYYGSFTTPTLDIADQIEDSIGCAESVVWTVFKEPLKISYHQLKRFWGLKTKISPKKDT